MENIMKVNEIVSEGYQAESWKVWFEGRFAIAGKSKALGFNVNGKGTNATLIDLEFANGEPTVSADNFVKMVAKEAKLDSATQAAIKKAIEEGGYKALFNKKF
jgi:hypothetical protein